MVRRVKAQSAAPAMQPGADLLGTFTVNPSLFPSFRKATGLWSLGARVKDESAEFFSHS